MDTQRHSVASGLRDAERRLRAAYVVRDVAEMRLQRERLEYFEELALRLASEREPTRDTQGAASNHASDDQHHDHRG